MRQTNAAAPKGRAQRYIIYGAKDNGNPNREIFFMGNKHYAKAIYKKLLRLNDLRFPLTPALQKEHDHILRDLEENDIVTIFGDDEHVEDNPIDWELFGVAKIEEVNILEE